MFRIGLIVVTPLLLSAWPHLQASGQHEELLADARSAAMGSAAAALQQNRFTFGNPASHKSEGLAISVFGSRMNGWSGGDCITAGILSGFRSYAFGAGVWRFGDDLYNRQIVSGLVAHGIGNTRLGLRLDWNQFSADGQPVQRNLAFTLGGLTRLHSGLVVGAFAENPGMAGVYGKPMAIRFSAGIRAHAAKGLSITTAVVQEVRSPASWSAGLEYAYRDKVSIRLGTGLYPYRFSAGAGFYYWRVAADFAMVYSYHTGAAMQATATYRPTWK